MDNAYATVDFSGKIAERQFGCRTVRQGGQNRLASDQIAAPVAVGEADREPVPTTQAPAAAVAQNSDGTWTQNGVATPYNWTDTTNWAGGHYADGIGHTANFTTAGLQALMDVSLTQNQTIGNLNFSNPTNNFGWLIDQGSFGPFSLNLQTSSGTPTITVTGPSLTGSASTTSRTSKVSSSPDGSPP